MSDDGFFDEINARLQSEVQMLTRNLARAEAEREWAEAEAENTRVLWRAAVERVHAAEAAIAATGNAVDELRAEGHPDFQ